MKKTYTLQLTVLDTYGDVAYKQAARVTINGDDWVEASTPIALNVADQLRAGTMTGRADVSHGSVRFVVESVEAEALEDSTDFALVDALLFWDDKKTARLVLSSIMRGDRVEPAVANRVQAYIERHPVLDTMSQDLAIARLDRAVSGNEG